MTVRSCLTILGLLCLLSSSAQAADEPRVAGPVGKPMGQNRAQLHWVPVYVHGQPTADLLQMRVCRPKTNDPTGVIVINHGSPDDASDRPKMEPTNCGHQVAHFFLERNLIVAFPLRRGYGATGGAWVEDYGPCSSPDFKRAGLASAEDIDSSVRYLRGLKYVNKDRVLILGQSAGGWATLAYASTAPENIWGFIDFAGGRAGHSRGLINNPCRPDVLTETAGEFGRTARQPMLWVFTENDSFFNPRLSRGMYDAFTKAGGKAEYNLLEPFGKDGHNLFMGKDGSAIWGPLVDSYLKTLPPL